MATSANPACGYRKKECHQSPLWRILCDHLDTFLSQYDRRFLDSHGPLAPWAEETLYRLVRCGDPNFGVSLLHCKECNIKLAVPYSCKTRICPSCVNRRAEDQSHLLAERLPAHSYRHVVITFPKKMGLRKRFQQDPSLYRKFGRLLHRTLSAWMVQNTRCHRHRRDEKEQALPGIIMATQSFGDELKPHAHYHLLVSDGVFFPDGDFYALGYWDEVALRERIRQAVTRSLVARKLLRKETADILLSWPIERSGFSVFVGPSLALPEEAEDIRRVLRYILRSSFPLNRISYDERTARVDFRTTKGRFKSWPHAVEFLAALSQHIPKPRQHLVTYAGWFANALHNLSPKEKHGEDGQAAQDPRSRWTRWAALVLRTWQVDPELCPRCRKPMARSKTIYERVELKRLLEGLGIGGYPLRPRSPPPPEEEDSPIDIPCDTHSQVPPDWENWEAA